MQSNKDPLAMNQIVCRTCLEEISDSDYLILNDDSNNVRNELLSCIPELDLGLVPDAAICIYCANSLRSAYDFKQKCLQTEKKIRARKRYAAPLNLFEIKQEEDAIEEKFNLVPGGSFSMDTVFIKDSLDTDCTIIENSISDKLPVKSKQSRNAKLTKHKPIILLQPKASVKTKSIDRDHARGLSLAKQMVISKNYRCQNCSYQTPYKKCLSSHLNLCQLAKTNQQHVISQEDDLNERLRCQKCSFVANNVSAFRRHLGSHASTSSYKCKSCGEQSSNITAFRRHLIGHHKKNKALHCSLCDYCTDYSTALENHARTHTGEKRFACTECNYKAIQKGNLKNHMKHHTNKGPLKCSLCSYSVSFKASLQHHMKFHNM